MFLSCRPFVVITTLSTGLVGVEVTSVSWPKPSSHRCKNMIFKSNIVRVNKSRRLRWASHIARMEEDRSAFKILTGKRPLERPRRRWEDNIRMDLKEIGINIKNWID